MDRQPFTEQSNPKSENIDVSSPGEIVNILSSCDDELFDGFGNGKGLFDSEVLQSMERVTVLISEILKKPEDAAIILSGCGTSGRLAFMVSSNFNLKLKYLNLHPCFNYLLAGGDKALFTSQEAVEDDPIIGRTDLIQVIEGKSRVLYIGITCGLSAPYVGGQLEYSIQHSDIVTPVLMGFNPISFARNNPVEKWDKTFKDICIQMEKEESEGRAFIINPVVGPEPITGSSRMKGGSATKILLDSLFTSAFLKANLPVAAIVEDAPTIKQLIAGYKFVKEATYKKPEELAKVVAVVGNNILQNGHIYYISDDKCGIVGLIDASECPPTYGASLNDVRGFLKDGYLQLGNKDGDISGFFDISKDFFTREVVPSLTSHDTIIILEKCHLSGSVINAPATKVKLHVVDTEKNPVSTAELLDIPIAISKSLLIKVLGETSVDFCWNLYIQMALKWACNVISTGCHILKGKVCQNIMVDVKVSNNKLYHRGIAIVEKLGHCSRDAAVSYLLKAIYGVDKLTTDVKDAPLSKHIFLATPQPGIVPVAIVMARTDLTYQNARRQITKNPVIRHMLAELLQ